MSDAGLGANLWVSHWNALSVALEGAGTGVVTPDVVRREGQNDTLV
jgi:hypothetical protein